MVLLVGCGRSPEVAYKLNSVELLKQEKLFLDNGDHFDDSYKREIGSILTAVFGTPNDPLLPVLLKDDDPVLRVINSQHVARSAGPVNRDYTQVRNGLYRQHCAHCHGITGDGHGPTAPFLNPYPRDFRMAKFKYKATPLRSVPTDHDLTDVLINGVPGTAMPSFRTMDGDQIAALVDYVKFLTMRGQYERFLMAELSNLDQGEPLIDLALAKQYRVMLEVREPTQQQQQQLGQLEEKHLDTMWSVVGARLIEDVIARWVDADKNRTAVPSAPNAYSRDDRDHQDFLEKGRRLFYEKGNCAQCHGDTGVGNGQLENFDDWTNDWIKTPGVNPFYPNSYREFTDAGALAPRPIKPRNLTEAVYRGGGQPEEIYLRIANGIEGTPMPAAPALSSDEIWALVAYVKALPYSRTYHWPAKGVNANQIAR